MRKIKHLIAAALAAAAMTLAACGGTAASSASSQTSSVSTTSVVETSTSSSSTNSVPASSSSEAVDTSSVSASSAIGPDANVKDVAPDLSVILTEISTDVEIGTAGSSLKATIVAADVLDFTMATDISEEYLKSQTQKYMEGLTGEDQVNFPDQMVMLGEAIHTLKDGDSESMLEDAGVTESSYPWNDEAFAKADAILQGAGI